MGDESELDTNKRLGLEIRERIESSTESERIQLLDKLYNKWKHGGENIFDYMKVALGNFDLDYEDLRIGNFERAYKMKVFEVTYLHLIFMQDKMSIEDEVNDESDELDDPGSDELKIIEMKFNKIFASITDAENAIRTSLFLQSSMSEQEYVQSDTDFGLYRFVPMNFGDMTSYQKLLIFLLEQLHRKGYRRYNGECYKQIFTKEGYDTHSWKRAMSIKEFIHNLTDNRNLNPEMWKNQTQSKNNVQAACEYLTEYIGGEFEDITRDRHVFSFNNGIYITKKYDEEKGIYHDEWIPYKGEGSKSIGSSVVACKHYNENFNYEKNMKWFDILTKYCPNFKSIMDYQEWPEEVQKWLCIMIGRNMYNLGELEEWQILAYLLGQAATGKSYLAGTPILMYDGHLTNIEDLRVGDVLMGDDSKPRNVLSCSAGVDIMYKIKPIKAEEYIVNGLHILCLKMTYCNKGNDNRIINGKKYKKGDTVEITVEDYIKLSGSQKKALKGYRTAIEFEEKELPLDPYILGLWLGDGTSSSKDMITNGDSAILHYLANELPKHGGYLKGLNGRYSYQMVGIDCNILNLKNNKHIPDIYKINSRKNRLQLLAGLLDTDGSYDFKRNTFDFIQKSKAIAEDVEYLARSLGFYAKINTCKKGCMYKGEYREGTYYRMCITGELYRIPTKVKRKQAKYIEKMKRNVLHTGITVEKLEVDYFYGVQVDGNHRMVLGDFTVAHNSTILTKIVKMIYEPCDIGVLSNNIERKFGLSALSEKFMFVGPEIKGNLAMEQSEFQSLISGEDIQVAEKHKVAKSVVWTVPGMLAGNEVPSYTDNAGSISRRLMVFKFDKKVKKGDTRLGQKLLKEITYIIQACNRGYQEAVNTHGEKDIWSCVPDYFRKTKDSMAENTNALTNFLNSDKVRTGDDLYVLEKLFIQTFNEHCRDNHLGAHKWNSDYYLGPFASKNVHSKKSQKLRYPNIPGGRTRQGTFIFGVDIVSDLDDNNDDPEQ
jgi:hypothetical protein